MRTLECGCEVGPLGNLLSVCALHAEHARAVATVNRNPRQHTPEAADEMCARQYDLAKALAPVILERWGTVTDPESTAEALFQHVHAILKRLD